MLSDDQTYRVFTPLSHISKKLIATTLLQEDQYFWYHMGINPVSILKAGFETYVMQHRRIGASTITMQLARLRFQLHSKYLPGKAMQLFRALQLEWHYSKHALLEAYLNLAPYGGNIEGIGAASLIYFNKPAQDLTLTEALTLSIIPQNPRKRTAANPKLAAIRMKQFNRWTATHPEDAGKVSQMNLPISMRRIQSLPLIAPHLLTQLTHHAPQQTQTIVTTIDTSLQSLTERLLQGYVHRKNTLGVTNAAALLLDTRDMGVKALVGSADFFNARIQGQINGTTIKRSPGSTLKPFIYALAFDQGLIHPNTVLKDVPHRFGNYNPENFDNEFMGPIKARDALVLSRNIPAVYLASQLSHPTLYDLLDKAHITQLKPSSYYGLALSLGGVEVSMQELVGLYAMLANQGVWQPLRLRQDAPLGERKRLLSPEASFLVLDSLQATARPDTGVNNTLPPVAWKTGTSSGYRDAWSIGVAGPYVLAVWIGHFNNHSNHAFVGKTMAAPLFFEILQGIQQAQGLPARDEHPEQLHLTRIPVCKASGLLPTRYCHETAMTWFIPGKSPIQSDTVFREVAINKKTGLRTCHIDKETVFKIYEFWPSDLLAIFKKAGMQRPTPPAYEADCPTATNQSMPPQISSPQTDVTYIAHPQMTLPFTAVTDADVKTLYWFINNSYVAKTKATTPLLWPLHAGKFIVRVVDDHGLSDARDIVITQAR